MNLKANLITKKIGKINLPVHKSMYYTLASICGIGYINSAKICKLLNISRSIKFKDLDNVTYEKLNTYLSEDFYNLDNIQYPLYKYVYHVKRANIKAKILTNTEEGKNHEKGYRVNGQKRK